MGHNFTSEEHRLALKRSIRTRQKNATKFFENKLIATLQQIEIDKANDIYRKGIFLELFNNMPEIQKEKYIVPKKGLSDENLKLVLQQVFNISIMNKDNDAE